MTSPTSYGFNRRDPGGGAVVVTALGSQGPQGGTGSQGAQGATGGAGSQGVQGAVGSQGNQGFQGPAGSQGNQGFQGNQGNQGFQGNQGNQGFQGSFVSPVATAVEFDGTLTLKSHLLTTQTTAPTASVGAALGGTGAAVAITAGSTDEAGTITFTAGSSGSGAGTLSVVTFNTTFSAAPKAILLTPANANAGNSPDVYVAAKAAGSFTLATFGTVGSGFPWVYHYFVIG